MAEVFLAKAAGPMGFEKTLVVKRILPELAEEPAFVQMFLSEAKLAARLTHPNIVQIFDFGQSEGAYFLAMEYIDGPSLRMLIKRAVAQELALPSTVCARLISLACEGLAFAHDFADPDTGEPLSLIHRDISPDNILLSRQGAVKVVDFGIAKAAGQSHKTESGVVKGKLAYMPPEQLRAKVVDRRADVYALGVVLYELLTGQRPYSSESDAGLMQAILYEPPIPAAQVRPDLPQPLRRILGKAIAKEREQRYPDCHVFQADLEAFIVSSGKPVTAQQVAQLITQATSKTDTPALTPPPASPTPAVSPPSEPPFLKRRTSSSTNTALTANLRASQLPRKEEPGTTGTPPPRPERTAQIRPALPSRLPPPPSTLDVDPQEHSSTEKSRSSNRWGLLLLGALLLAMGSGVVSWLMDSRPEMSPPSLAAEAPAKPPEPRLPPSSDGGVPDAGSAVVLAAPPSQELPPVNPKRSALAPPESMLTGIVELRIWPYATVFVNGKRMGDTPMAPLELSEGRHVLKFVNAKLSKTVLRAIDLKPGQYEVIKANLIEE
ncbi:serine/threonine protein kinase [Archangium sp.]|uniref:serine/threonine protein kinase n=1 Tax=Archangium sp. TaxID=1872627 RepID=UPI0039C8B309